MLCGKTQMHDITKKRFASVLIVIGTCIMTIMLTRPTLPTPDAFPINTTRHALVSLLTVEGPQAWWVQKKYIASAEKLARSFRAHSNQDMVLLVVDEFRALRKADEQRLRESGWLVHRVQSGLVPRSEAWNRYYSSKLFSKLLVWRLTRYEQVLYTDLDTLFVQSPKRLFQMRLSVDNPAMALDTTHRHYYNAGVVVLRPSEDEYQRLVSAMDANTHSGENAEQDFLNIFYHSRIVQLDTRFNTQVCTKEEKGCINDEALKGKPFERWIDEHKTVVVHFAGRNKPWNLQNCVAQKITQLCIFWKRF
jgi:lipopolysaccharide biosynthesis glycosyltransferase